MKIACSTIVILTSEYTSGRDTIRSSYITITWDSHDGSTLQTSFPVLMQACEGSGGRFAGLLNTP